MNGLGAFCILVLVYGCVGEEVKIGDTMVDKSVYERFSTGKSPENVRVSRTAALSHESGLLIWEYMSEDGQNFIIPYRTDQVTNQAVSDNIDEAIATFNGLNLCIKFKNMDDLNEENSTNANNWLYHVDFTDQLGTCYTFIGVRYSDPNVIAIDPSDDECNSVITLLRYFVHTLGFFAEHNRPDRDQHIKVVNRNIMKKYEAAFEKLEDWVVDTKNLPYDFESITHYPASKFGKNGRRTIKMRDGSRFDYVNEEISELDKQAIKILYNCPGVSYDLDYDCAEKKKYYFCYNHPSMMKVGCSFTCGFGECEDDEDFCANKSDEDCYEESEIGTMQQGCPLKCGYCGHGCHDYDEEECKALKQRGDCDTNRSHMAQVCPRTCNLCINSN